MSKLTLCFLEVDELMKINKNIKFASTTQKQLFDRLANKNFTIEEEYIQKISEALPDGVNVKELEIKNIDAKSLYESYTKKVDELERLSNQQKELLKKEL